LKIKTIPLKGSLVHEAACFRCPIPRLELVIFKLYSTPLTNIPRVQSSPSKTIPLAKKITLTRL